jgi:alkylation response protein AidB-like acyl-CoA dehydrogenase
MAGWGATGSSASAVSAAGAGTLPAETPVTATAWKRGPCYLREYAVARAWADSRAQSIYGGTTEIQKEIIGRSLGL